jgi:hypothetical protein
MKTRNGNRRKIAQKRTGEKMVTLDNDSMGFIELLCAFESIPSLHSESIFVTRG